MEAIISIFIFIFGIILGSFLNSVIWRLQNQENPFLGRSHCPKCNHTLSFFDLVPILSFIFLKGKCRYCKEKISLQYPLVEFFTGFLFFLAYYKFTFYDFKTFFYFFLLLVIISFLILIFVFDLQTYLIPDSFLALGILFSFFYNLPFFLKNFSYLNLFLCFLPAIFLFFLWLISKGNWIGFGDVKMAIFMALFLLWPKVLLAMFLSFLFGAILGTILIFLGKKTLKSQIPFGPFLVLGTLTAFFFGENIINYYLDKFFF